MLLFGEASAEQRHVVSGFGCMYTGKPLYHTVNSHKAELVCQTV